MGKRMNVYAEVIALLAEHRYELKEAGKGEDVTGVSDSINLILDKAERFKGPFDIYLVDEVSTEWLVTIDDYFLAEKVLEFLAHKFEKREIVMINKIGEKLKSVCVGKVRL